MDPDGSRTSDAQDLKPEEPAANPKPEAHGEQPSKDEEAFLEDMLSDLVEDGDQSAA